MNLMKTNQEEKKPVCQILSQVIGCEPEFVDALDDQNYAQYLCDLLNESGGNYIKYWVEPLPTE